MYFDFLTASLVSLALIPVTLSAEIYTKSSPVLQIDARSYERLIAKSNYTSIVEFYAPWCGHCQNLKPAYEKAAQSLSGIARVAAINCDEDGNKPFCGSMGVQGFPTLKIVQPSKKPGGKPAVEDYQGQRSAKAINDALIDKLPNHVSRLKDDTMEAWLQKNPERPKALFFSQKGVVSPLIKALAIDFLGSVDIAQMKSSEKVAVEKYGVTTFPSVVLLAGKDAEAVQHSGDMKKPALLAFLSQAAAPNPDATPSTDAPPKSSKKASASTAKKDKAKAAASKSDPKAASETLEANTPPMESPDPQVSPDAPQPVRLPVVPAPPLRTLADEVALQRSCLHSGAGICVLAFAPPAAPAPEPTPSPETDPQTDSASSQQQEQQQPLSDSTPQASHAGLTALSEIAHKHHQRGAKLFPIYAIPSTNTAGATLLSALGSGPQEIEGFTLVAVNAKKGWWTAFSGPVIAREPIEAWIDTIRFGEAKKERLPEGIVGEIIEKVDEKEQPKKQGKPVELNFDSASGPGVFEMGDGMRVEMVEIDDEHDEL